MTGSENLQELIDWQHVTIQWVSYHFLTILLIYAAWHYLRLSMMNMDGRIPVPLPPSIKTLKVVSVCDAATNARY